MTEQIDNLAMAGFALTALALMLGSALKGWQGWLELKRLELAGGGAGARRSSAAGPAERIELADLKERIRKLESLAACIDL
ncbi:MAG: hypothetical protein QOH04_2701 [Sphingomonadales bacterium]|nr:hypothetical protein [Sphingomonadales bacterium]MEA3036924.1 hypothetical protein [Sphingomonadales bacterium]